MNHLKRAAHDYVDRGWPVLPVEPRGKEPLGWLAPHGFKNATLDHRLIDKWWREEPDCNIGLRTGTCFDVLDSDGEQATEALPAHLQSGDPPIVGPTVLTSRGWHCYFTPSGLTSRKLAPALDLKAKMGYVLAPPSVHPSGATYRWYAGTKDLQRGVDAPIPPVPTWLVDLLRRRSYEAHRLLRVQSWRAGGRNAGKPYGKRALASEARRLAQAREGERNKTLNTAAFRLGQLIPTGALDVDAVLDALVPVADHLGLSISEAEKTIASGLLAGARNPRRS